jgi:hypothetical protein
MITVFQVSKPGTLSTRLFLPETAWGEVLMARLEAEGYTLSVCDDQTQFPEPRDAAELARRDELLFLMD